MASIQILVDMAADRGAFIDQSQSFNVHMSDVNFGKLTSLHFYAWKVRAASCCRCSMTSDGCEGSPDMPEFLLLL